MSSPDYGLGVQQANQAREALASDRFREAILLAKEAQVNLRYDPYGEAYAHASDTLRIARGLDGNPPWWQRCLYRMDMAAIALSKTNVD